MFYTTIQEIQPILNIEAENTNRLEKILENYPMRIPDYYLSLINADDPYDPIRKMCVPTLFEADKEGSFDTSGEKDNTVIPGMQHKYHKTAMILTTNQCAMYCRHCFRKRLVGLQSEEVATHKSEILSYIRQHPEINNVLLSGGDSFMNSNSIIRSYLEDLCQIDSLDYIRFGTRVPVVYPQRISQDKELLNILESFSEKKKIMIVTQFNHPRELTAESTKAIEKILDTGIPVLNQCILMQGINDEPEILGRLLSDVTEAGIIPYYVYQCRPVTGVKNYFQIPLKKGYQIVEEAKSYQNGIGKSFRYCLSHHTGKIEILGELPTGEMLFKYHEAKQEKDMGRIFTQTLDDSQTWLA